MIFDHFVLCSTRWQVPPQFVVMAFDWLSFWCAFLTSHCGSAYAPAPNDENKNDDIYIEKWNASYPRQIYMRTHIHVMRFENPCIIHELHSIFVGMQDVRKQNTDIIRIWEFRIYIHMCDVYIWNSPTIRNNINSSASSTYHEMKEAKYFEWRNEESMVGFIALTPMN